MHFVSKSVMSDVTWLGTALFLLAGLLSLSTVQARRCSPRAVPEEPAAESQLKECSSTGKFRAALTERRRVATRALVREQRRTGPPLQEPSASLTSTSMAHPAVLGRRISVFIIMILCLTVACEALPQGKRAEALLRPVAGGRVVVHAASPLPEMAYVKQRPFRDSLRVKKNGGAERFFDKDVDAFFVNND